MDLDSFFFFFANEWIPATTVIEQQLQCCLFVFTDYILNLIFHFIYKGPQEGISKTFNYIEQKLFLPFIVTQEVLRAQSVFPKRP